MAKLPVTVTSVQPRRGGNYAVTVAYNDGTAGQFIIPPTLATAEAVTISALAMATLSDIATHPFTFHGHHHRRYDPRVVLPPA